MRLRRMVRGAGSTTRRRRPREAAAPKPALPERHAACGRWGRCHRRCICPEPAAYPAQAAWSATPREEAGRRRRLTAAAGAAWVEAAAATKAATAASAAAATTTMAVAAAVASMASVPVAASAPAAAYMEAAPSAADRRSTAPRARRLHPQPPPLRIDAPAHRSGPSTGPTTLQRPAVAAAARRHPLGRPAAAGGRENQASSGGRAPWRWRRGAGVLGRYRAAERRCGHGLARVEGDGGATNAGGPRPTRARAAAQVAGGGRGGRATCGRPCEAGGGGRRGGADHPPRG